jgi:hypothetical protein
MRATPPSSLKQLLGDWITEKGKMFRIQGDFTIWVDFINGSTLGRLVQGDVAGSNVSVSTAQRSCSYYVSIFQGGNSSYWQLRDGDPKACTQGIFSKVN